MENSLPLHLCHASKSSLIINRLHMSLHGVALIALLCYRASSLEEVKRNHSISFILCYVLVFASELILSFLWLLSQSCLWRPVKRTVFIERLPEDDKLPAIDIFVCTADPNKEPSVEVMNTVISAMALDYPPDKLHVYLSDDGGSSVTLKAMREAWKFAQIWLPFCRRYGIKTRCPEAYFSGNDDCDGNLNFGIDFEADKKNIEKQYNLFKESLKWITENMSTIASKDHHAKIEIIRDKADDSMEESKDEMPLLVYVAREKRPSHPHNFKAGALNVLLRVSGLMTNAPYILGLDCDMYCNDSSSARQALCIHLDSEINSKLAFVQYPQTYHNVSAKDIYDSRHRFFQTLWPGADGINGMSIAGTGFYIKREALCGISQLQEDADLSQLQKIYGPSNDFIKSIYLKNHNSTSTDDKKFSSSLKKEMEFLASCSYEKETQWGVEVGFRNSIVEDYVTSVHLFCNGWKSAYLDPEKPAFLGSTPTNLSDYLVQHTRWFTGIFGISISKFSPLIYGPTRGMSILHSMFLAKLSWYCISSLPLWILTIIPQLCLLHGVSLYPEASSPFFTVFVFVFLSSNLKHIQEVLSDGYSIRTWIYEQRMWMIKSVTCYTYGSLNAILDKIGLKKSHFFPTNKVADDEQLKRYQSGVFDFQASTMFIAPMCISVILNIASLLLGAAKIFRNGNYGEMFIQTFISFFILVVQYPIIEGMLFRKDNGRISHPAALLSAFLAAVILILGGLLAIY